MNNKKIEFKQGNHIMGFDSAISQFYLNLDDPEKNALVQNTLRQPSSFFEANHSLIFPRDRQPMLEKITMLNTYLRNLRKSLSFPTNQNPFSLEAQPISQDNSQSKSARCQAANKPESSAYSHKMQRCSDPFKNKDGSCKRLRKYWSKQEDKKLLELIKIYGTKWSKIGILLNNKSGKQVRDRYLNYIDPSINNNSWSVQEDAQLEELHAKYGHRWKYIATLMPGRTENQVKNRFYRKENYGKDKKETFSLQTTSERKVQKVKRQSIMEMNLDHRFKNEIDSKLEDMPQVKKEEAETTNVVHRFSAIYRTERSKNQIKIEPASTEGSIKYETEQTQFTTKMDPDFENGLTGKMKSESGIKSEARVKSESWEKEKSREGSNFDQSYIWKVKDESQMKSQTEVQSEPVIKEEFEVKSESGLDLANFQRIIEQNNAIPNLANWPLILIQDNLNDSFNNVNEQNKLLGKIDGTEYQKEDIERILKARMHLMFEAKKVREISDPYKKIKYDTTNQNQVLNTKEEAS